MQPCGSAPIAARPQNCQHERESRARLQCFTPGNATLAISGAPLATAESLANDFLGALPARATPPKAPSTYVGGGSSEHYTKGSTAVVAFETDGWAAMDNSVLSTVVRIACSPFVK